MRTRMSWRRLIRMREQLTEARGVETITQTEERLRRALRITEDIRAASRCQRCGRKLTDPDSVKRGIGPECALVKVEA